MKVLKTTKENSGTYLLEFLISSEFSFENIKRLKSQTFPAGYYYYSGSAQKNLKSRLARHLKLSKTVHWHIDHITTNPDFIFKSINIFNNAPKDLECNIVEDLTRIESVELLVPNFGNGDCSTCESHLIYNKKRIPYNHLLSLYQDMVRFIPSLRVTF